MPQVSRSAQIAASPQDVIEYIADVDHHPAFIDSLKTVEDLSGNPRHAGTDWTWTFTFAGVELQGGAHAAAYVPGQRYSFRTTGGADTTFLYEVAPKDGGSFLTASCDYEIPQAVSAAVPDSGTIDRFVERVADDAIQNLKAIFEE